MVFHIAIAIPVQSQTISRTHSQYSYQHHGLLRQMNLKNCGRTYRQTHIFGQDDKDITLSTKMSIPLWY